MNFLIKLNIISFSCLFFLSNILSASIHHPDLDRNLNQLFVSLRQLELQGLFDGEILIAKGNRPLFHLQSHDISFKDPQFMIGSVTKQFFAAALLKALYDSSKGNSEKEKISEVKKKLHQPISEYLSKQCALWQGEMPSWAYTVTLHHLLSHTSGIPNYTDSKNFNNKLEKDPEKLFFESYHKPNEILQLIEHRPLNFEPGSHFSYSNTGYLLVAEVIEAITKMPAAAYVEKVLCAPIGLTATVNPSRGISEEIRMDPKCSKLVFGLEYDPSDFQNLYAPMLCEDISITKGAGSIISTASDLLRWNQALHKSHRVLSDALYELMITENLEGYGYGLGVKKTSFGLIYTHPGKIGTYRSVLCYYPDEDLSIIVLCNVSYDRQKAKALMYAKYPSRRGFEPIKKLIDDLFE